MMSQCPIMYIGIIGKKVLDNASQMMYIVIVIDW